MSTEAMISATKLLPTSLHATSTHTLGISALKRVLSYSINGPNRFIK